MAEGGCLFTSRSGIERDGTCNRRKTSQMGRGLLDGRIALVTGAGQGLGRGISLEFADEGAVVVLFEVNVETLQECHEEIESRGGRAISYRLDVMDYDACRESLAEVERQHGNVDVLVNNAAICVARGSLDYSLEEWRRHLTVNLEAVYMLSRLTIPGMMEKGFGRIINITSINAFVSNGHWAPYDAAKGGITALTKALAVEFGHRGVAVNAIAPGFMRTPMSVVDGVDETTTREFQTWYVKMRHIPMACEGYPEDVAGTAVFLASDYCRYMTGQVLVVDGGMTSRTGYDHPEQ